MCACVRVCVRVSLCVCVTVSQDQGASEVETLRAQMQSLFDDLQKAQNKLDQAEDMKKGLQDRWVFTSYLLV